MRCADRPIDADGSIPSEPARTLASSERMSPNRFSVTSTSKIDGFVTSTIAQASTSRCSTSTSGYSGRISSTTFRQSRLDDSTFALSTLVRRLPPAPGELEGEPHDPLDLLLGVRQRVDGFAPRRRGPLLRRLAEVEPAGELADDEHVDALEQLGPQRCARDERGMDRDRAQIAEQDQAPAQGQEPLLGADRGVRVVPLRAPDGAEEDRVGRGAGIDVLVADGNAVGVDRRAAHEDLVPRDPESEPGADRVEDAPDPPGRRRARRRRRGSRRRD